jgi:hypothetical protein
VAFDKDSGFFVCDWDVREPERERTELEDLWHFDDRRICWFTKELGNVTAVVVCVCRS